MRRGQSAGRSLMHEPNLQDPKVDVASTYRYFDQVADGLELSLPERLMLVGGMSPTTYRRRLKGQSSSFQPVEAKRLELFLSIYREACHMSNLKQWLRGGHRAPAFGGKSPLSLMLKGSTKGLEQTHGYLRDMYGGWA